MHGAASPQVPEMEQFETLAARLFPTAGPQARAKGAAILGRAETAVTLLEGLVVENIGEDLISFLAEAASSCPSQTMLDIIARYDVAACATLARPWQDLSNVVLAKLFQMNSRKVYRALAANTSIVPRGAVSQRPGPLGADGPHGRRSPGQARRFRRRPAGPGLFRPVR
jgi:hypothetical protein